MRDPIYGYVEIPARLAPMVDNPLTQRLRRVGQTSMTQAVYPAATGSRFEHALGVMHLARRAWRAAWSQTSGGAKVQARFAEAVSEDVRITSRDFAGVIEDAVGVVGLLHDLGHPPFSHVLEEVFSDLAAENGWMPSERPRWIKSSDFHEFAGVVLLDQLCDDVRPRFPDDGDDLLGLISTIYNANPVERSWAGALHAIVAGEIDVDRLDYLMRDAQKAGTEFGAIDYERLVDALELHPVGAQEWRIAPGIRARSAVETLLVQRSQAYRWIIFHSRVVGTNLALAEAVRLLLKLGRDGTRLRFSPDDEVTVGEVFARTIPNLNYLSPTSRELAVVRRTVPSWLGDEAVDDGVVKAVRRDLQAFVDDATVVSMLQTATALVVALLEGGERGAVELPAPLRNDLTRYRTFARTVLDRERNFVAAWKTVDEFARAVDRYAAEADGTPKDPELQDALESIYGDVVATLRERGSVAAAEGYEEEHRARRARLRGDPPAEVNDLFRTLVAGSRARQAKLCDLLADAETQFKTADGFWRVAYASFKPVEEDEKAGVLFDGSTVRNVRETSALARALEDVEEHRPRLFIYFFVTAADLESWRAEHVESARASLISAFLQTFPMFLQAVMRDFLLVAAGEKPEDR